MKITCLVENTTCRKLPTEHGLSLFIEMNNGRCILFDMGQRCLFDENAMRLGLNIADVDVAIVSHGHYDHGGGLRHFLHRNSKAKIFVLPKAFDPHFSIHDDEILDIGLDYQIKDEKRFVFCKDEYEIPDVGCLFSNVKCEKFAPLGNRFLLGEDGKARDDFAHEQNLIIREGDNIVLFAGCAHCGIVNIIEKEKEIVGKLPSYVFAGMHLVKSGLDANAEHLFIESLAMSLNSFANIHYYTMHCTGMEQYSILKEYLVDKIDYFSCGESIII